MIKRKKIGLMIPNLQSGGAERVLAITSKLLSQEGHDVYLILFDSDNISFEYSGKLIDLRSKAGSNYLSKILKRVYRIIKLSYFKYKYNLDFVISFLFSANVVNYYSFGKAKKIISCRGYSDFIKNGKKYTKMLNKVDHLIVQTERMKSDFMSFKNVISSKIKIINNPFDITEIDLLSKESVEKDIYQFIESHTTICTVGSFKRDKGYWHLIRTFIQVKQSVKNAGLIFIGNRGEMEEQIKVMAFQSGYISDILFIGKKENPFKYISKCKLYVSSSLYEGFPNVLVEAMACGVPVLSTDCRTGPREIVSEISEENSIEKSVHCRYGILTKNLTGKINFNANEFEEEEIQMADEIIRLLLDEQLAHNYSKASINRAKMFDKKNYLIELVKIIN